MEFLELIEANRFKLFALFSLVITLLLAWQVSRKEAKLSKYASLGSDLDKIRANIKLLEFVVDQATCNGEYRRSIQQELIDELQDRVSLLESNWKEFILESISRSRKEPESLPSDQVNED